VHSRWRNAIAADVVRNVITGHGIGHRDHCALAGGICKAIRESGRACDRCHVKNYPTTRLHLADTGANAIVVTLHVYAVYAVKVIFSCALDVADVRHARIVDQNVNRPVLGNFGKLSGDFRLIGDVAGAGKGLSA